METPEQQLLAHRAQIDALDEQLAQLLIARMQVIGEVAALKAKHWPNSCHIRPAREGQMHRAMAARFTGTNFPPRLALAMWRQLIGGSTHLESPLNVTYDAQYPEHRWLAREYFGVQVGTLPAPSVEASLASLKNGASNLLLLTGDLSAPCWSMAEAIRAAGLMIFAALPVTTGGLPEGAMPALALATVTPEDSGNDVSYFARADGTVTRIHGFVTAQENSIFLGAHPTPIMLDNGA